MLVLINCHLLEKHPHLKFNYDVNLALKLCNNYLFLGGTHHKDPLLMQLEPSALSNNINYSLGMVMSSKFIQNAAVANTESSGDAEKPV